MSNKRKAIGVEFLRHLAFLMEIDHNFQKFSKAINKQPQNVSKYLSGTLVPGPQVLRSSVSHAFEWRVEPLYEIREIKPHLNSVDNIPGIYALYDSSGSAIYVGKATKLKAEINQTLNREMNFPVRLGPHLSKKTHRKYKIVAKFFSAYSVPSPRMRHNLEALLLRVFPNQSHDNQMGNFQ